MQSHASALALLVLLLAFSDPISRSAKSLNLVANGDFSRVENGRPVGWAISGDPNHVDQTLQVISEKGNPCARLQCTRFEGAGGYIHAMVAQEGVVRLEKGKSYEFTCRARAEGIASHSAMVAIQDTSLWEGCGLHSGLTLDRRWRSYRFVFRATRSVEKTGRLQFWFLETGTLYLDDVRLTEIEEARVEFTDVVPPRGGKNLIPNGSFEAGSTGWSSLGISTGWGNLAHLHGQILSENAGSRGHFLRIPLGGASTPVLYFDYLKPVARRQIRVLAANLGWIPVQRDAPYTLSCDLRASEEGIRAVLAAIAADPADDSWSRQTLQTAVTLSKSWKRYAFTFHPTRRYVFIAIGPDLEEERRVHVDLDEVQLEQGALASPFLPRTPVEVGIEPSKPGGIFTAGQQASLSVHASNHGSHPAKIRIGLTAADGFDRPVKLPSLTLSIPAGSSIERPFSLPRDWSGFYRVRASWAAQGQAETQVLRLAFVPRRTEEDSVLGINHAFPDRYLIHLARQSGVTWYRDWSLKWEDIEPSPGEWHWETADEQIDRVLKEGVQLMALLPPFPSAEWSSEAPADIPREGYPGIRLRQAWAPKDESWLSGFIQKAVSRYRDRIRVWEFLNEPIYTTYSLPGEGVRDYPGRRYTPADYVHLLRKAAEAMRQSDPACRIMGGLGSSPEHLTRELMEAGILDTIDIFNLHLYPGTRTPEGYIAEMDRFLKEMEERGGRKPIWITEFSYYASDDLPRDPFVPSENNWAEERLLPSELEGASYTVRFFALMLARGVEKIFLHSGASGAANSPDLECCLFAAGGTPRKILPALALLTGLLGPTPKCILEKKLGAEGRLIAFETGRQSVLVLWDPSQEGMRVAVRARRIRLLDLMGQKIAAASIGISPAPIYVVGPPGQARKIAASVDVNQ